MGRGQQKYIHSSILQVYSFKNFGLKILFGRFFKMFAIFQFLLTISKQISFSGLEPDGFGWRAKPKHRMDFNSVKVVSMENT